jgi:MFS family permease
MTDRSRGSATDLSFTKWANLGALTIAELVIMGLWFSGSAVVPQFSALWDLGSAGRAWMTLSVQLGFVAGAVASAFLNLPDRVPLPRLIAISGLVGASATAGITLLHSPGPVIALRMATGAALAGVYPPGMKIVASWTRKDRGLGIGILVSATTIGAALPHLLNGLSVFGAGGMPPWRPTLLASALLATCGAGIVLFLVRPGPHLGQGAPFDWRYVGKALADAPMRLANFGYLGHMWELYAMWTWVPLCLLASFERVGLGSTGARLAGFVAIAAGGLGSILAGALADRVGRTIITSASLAISGACCLLAGLLFSSPHALVALCVVWGFAVVADSAQFSSAVSELADPRYVGTVLTVQTSLGFLLTLATIALVPALLALLGWEHVFWVLVPGPVFGIWSMLRLRARPESQVMAGGKR